MYKNDITLLFSYLTKSSPYVFFLVAISQQTLYIDPMLG